MLLTYIYIYIYIYIYRDIVPDVPDTSGESKNNIGAAFGGPKRQPPAHVEISLFCHLELVKAIKDSYNPEPKVTMMHYVHYIKEWLSPHLQDVHGHSQPLHFKFVKDDNTVKFFYKHWTSDPWSEEGIQILTVSRFAIHTYIQWKPFNTSCLTCKNNNFCEQSSSL